MPLSSIFTANRVAAISTWLTAFAALIVGVTGTLPIGWQNGAAVGAALLTKAVVTIKFMDGSQKFDALTAANANTKPLSELEQFIQEIQSTPEIPQAIIDQVAAATPVV